MSRRINFSIDLNKIDKAKIVNHANGSKYLNLVAYVNDAPDKFGNDFAIKQKATKQDVEGKVKLPYVGNGKWAETQVANSREEAAAQGRQQQAARRTAPQHEINDEDVPF